MSETITEPNATPNTTGAINYSTTWGDVADASSDAEARKKLEERFPPKTVRQLVPVALTAEERAAKGNDLAALVQEIDTAKTHLKETAAGLREEIKALENKRTQIAHEIAVGTQDVETECLVAYRWETNEVVTTRVDTGEVVTTRAISAEERQADLFDATSVAGEVDSPQELLDLMHDGDDDGGEEEAGKRGVS